MKESPSWFVFVPHIINQISTEPRGGHGKKFERQMWTWPVTFDHEMMPDTSPPPPPPPPWLYLSPVNNESIKYAQGRHSECFERPVWPRHLTVWRENGAPHRQLIGCICTISEANGSKTCEARGEHDKKFERPMWPWPFTFDPGIARNPSPPHVLYFCYISSESR